MPEPSVPSPEPGPEPGRPLEDAPGAPAVAAAAVAAVEPALEPEPAPEPEPVAVTGGGGLAGGSKTVTQPVEVLTVAGIPPNVSCMVTGTGAMMVALALPVAVAARAGPGGRAPR